MKIFKLTSVPSMFCKFSQIPTKIASCCVLYIYLSKSSENNDTSKIRKFDFQFCHKIKKKTLFFSKIKHLQNFCYCFADFFYLLGFLMASILLLLKQVETLNTPFVTYIACDSNCSPFFSIIFAN